MARDVGTILIMAYSKDLREKILEYIEKGHEHKQACRIFGVGLRTITRWKKLKSETGSLNTKELNRKPMILKN
jgi:transposase